MCSSSTAIHHNVCTTSLEVINYPNVKPLSATLHSHCHNVAKQHPLCFIIHCLPISDFVFNTELILLSHKFPTHLSHKCPTVKS